LDRYGKRKRKRKKKKRPKWKRRRIWNCYDCPVVLAKNCTGRRTSVAVNLVGKGNVFAVFVDGFG
jgi:transcription elongation factor Elf1